MRIFITKVELLNDGEVVDAYTERFWYSLCRSKDDQFLINNKTVLFQRICKHEDTFYSGRGLNEGSQCNGH